MSHSDDTQAPRRTCVRNAAIYQKAQTEESVHSVASNEQAADAALQRRMSTEEGRCSIEPPAIKNTNSPIQVVREKALDLDQAANRENGDDEEEVDVQREE
eukprot:CAMPEP_0183502436 /NCGR_PEP_ID=MMETSP0371-20130417/4230_1 /TAXON_ID=268820 /ORGANISM="Peridinium aciculiferum, Strain PAER-2" /LENGTH=100 /DNA_ID=CAMNT_0025697155 /DNA_START=16 /DNA_END=315 /DNA_ORIENTATION=-